MDLIINVAIFLIILLFTFFYSISSKSKSNFFLLLFSFLQGFILTFIYAEVYNKPLTEVLVAIPLFSATYYLLIRQIPYLIITLLSQRKKEDYKDEVLLNWLNTIEKLRNKKLILTKYAGPRSLNAFFIGIPIPFFKKINIVIGQKLIDIFNTKQRIVVIAHEVSHYLKKHILKRYLIFVILTIVIEFIFLFLSEFIVFKLTAPSEIITIIFFFAGLLFYLCIIIVFNAISWYVEFNADKNSLILTKDLINFEKVFEVFIREIPMKDYGRLLNLILYDHPLTENRIQKGKQFYAKKYQ